MRARQLFAATIVAVLAATACADSTATPPAGPDVQRQVPGVEVAVDFAEVDDVVALGWVLDRSAEWSRTEGRHYDALEAAVAARNTAGGIDGVPIELRGLDSAGDVSVALDGLRRLASGGVRIVVIGCDPGVAPAVANRAAGLGMVSFSVCSGDADVAVDAGPTNFALGLGDAEQGRMLAGAALDAGWVSVALVSDLNRPDGSRQCDAFAARFRASDGEVRVWHELIGPDADVAVALDDLGRFSSPDGFVLCLGPQTGEEAAVAIRARWSQPILVTASAEPPLLDGLALQLDDVAYLTNVSADDGGLAAAQTIIEILTAIGSDVPLAERAETGATEIADAVMGLDALDTALGATTFDDNNIRRPDGVGLRTIDSASPSLVAPGPPGTSVHPATVTTTTSVSTTLVPFDTTQ